MFIAMNRFKIALGFEGGFEKIWRERDSYLSEVSGFQSFSLLKDLKLKIMFSMLLIRYGSREPLSKPGPNPIIFVKHTRKRALRKELI